MASCLPGFRGSAPFSPKVAAYSSFFATNSGCMGILGCELRVLVVRWELRKAWILCACPSSGVFYARLSGPGHERR